MRKMRHGKDLTVVMEENPVLLYFKRTYKGDRPEKNTLAQRYDKM